MKIIKLCYDNMKLWLWVGRCQEKAEWWVAEAKTPAAGSGPCQVGSESGAAAAVEEAAAAAAL